MFVIVGGLVVAVLIAALLAPLFIDWTGYRTDFEREASKVLGRPVKVAGKASARILPFPSLSFSNVRVGEDVENPALTIDQFSMDAELAPFLSGEVLIFDMRVTRPRGVIVIDEQGQIDWTLRANTPFDPSNVRIENMVLEGGQFDVVDQAAGRTHSIVIPNAIVSAKALTGPWRMAGVARIDGEPLHVSVVTGQADKGALPLRISALPLDRLVLIESEGSAKAEDGTVSYAGSFTMRPALTGDYQAAQLKVPAGLSQDNVGVSYKVSGKFGLAPTGLALPEYRLETGARENPYIANGSGSVIFGASPMFDLKLDGTQVNLARDGEAGSGAGLTERIATVRDFVANIPMLTMPGTIAVNLPAIVAGDTTVRDVAFTATPVNGAWRVRDFKSTLPGRTQLEADGVLGQGEGFGFTGKLLVASNQPAGLADWLTGQVDPAIRKLSAIGFSSDVDLKPNVQSFAALELALGGATFTGSAERRTDGERPAMALSLRGGALDLDGLNALALGFIGTDGTSHFAGHDVTVSLDAGPVSKDGVEAQHLGLSLRMKQNVIEIDRLMISDIAGASLSATGQIIDPGVAFSGNIDASLISSQGSQVVDMLAARFPQNAFLQKLVTRLATVPDLMRDISATLIASTTQDGDERGATVSLNAKTPTGEWVFAGNGKGVDLSALAVSFQGSVRENDPLSLVALAGVPLVPMGAPAPAVVDFSGSGGLQTGIDTTVKFKAEGTNAGFNGALKFADTGTALSGTFSLKSNDFDPYLVASGLAFSGVGTGTELSVKADLATDATGLNFTNFDGLVGDNKVRGQGKFVSSERPNISGKFTLDRMDIAWFGENLIGTGTLDGGESGAAFSIHPVAPIDGRLEFESGVLSLGAFGEAHNAKGAIELSSNATRLSNISAGLFGGALTGSIDLRNDDGVAAMSGNFALQDAKASQIDRLQPVEGALDVNGSVTASGKTLEGVISGLTGSGVVTIRDGVVPGLNPSGFAALLGNYGQRDKAPVTSEVEAWIQSSVRTGRFPLSAKPVAWSMAGGTLRVPNITGNTQLANLNADLVVDLAAGIGTVSGSIEYVAGKDSVIGAEPVVPFVASVSNESASLSLNAQLLEQYFTQSALEREQARVEALQSALVEKQRLRRDVRLVASLYSEREVKAELREDAVRAQKAREGAMLLALWDAEKMRREKEAARLEAETKKIAEEKAAFEKSARDKAAQEAAKSELQPALPPLEPTLPKDKSLQDVFKSLEFDLNQ